MRPREGTRRSKRWILCLSLLLGAFVVGQPARATNPEDRLGTWVGATSNLRYSDRWSLFLQGELRTWEVASNLNELLFRAAGHYDLGPRTLFAFGYVRVDTFPFDDNRYDKFFENRFYQELLFRQSWGKGKAVHRFRLEQRWITSQPYGRQYTGRLRYMLNYTHPLGREKIEPGAGFLTVFNELFIDLDRGDYWFDLEEFEAGLNQNRLWAGGGYQLTPRSRLQAGVLWQHRPKADFIRVTVGYAHNFDFRSRAD